MCGFVGLLAGCALQRSPEGVGTSLGPEQAQAVIAAALPGGLADPAGWTRDIYTGFATQQLAVTEESVCAVVAVIEQESNFQVNPVIPGLGTIAWRQIDGRARQAGLPLAIVHGALALRSSDGRTYSQRIDAARTEKDLSDIFEDFIGEVPLGNRLFADLNPIRTRGPMQVNVAFARQYVNVRPYPYPLKGSLADALFTRRGSLYFGIAHLFAYQPPYHEYLFRFADFNAGQFASRNAAFQSAIGRISGRPLITDGALLPGDEQHGPGETQLALDALAPRLDTDARNIDDALHKGRSEDLEQTRIYQRVFALAERSAGHPLPRAIVPVIKLQGPKISRILTTSWYAHRVQGRFDRCLRRAR